jgi:hypothetical protein
MTQKTLTYDDLDITLEDIYEAMGYHGVQPDDATLHETQVILDDVRHWLRPQFCFLVVQHDIGSGAGR